LAIANVDEWAGEGEIEEKIVTHESYFQTSRKILIV
jgi:hypothetical protein